MVLVVGATGSLGTALVPELERRGIHLRILGRSRESFVKAGLTEKKDLSLVVCADVTDRDAFQDEWFLDVQAVVCVARPRAGKTGDREAYVSLIQNWSDAACTNGVQHMLLLSIPYLDQYLFGMIPTLEAVQSAAMSARERFDSASDSQLSIVRIAEFSEIGILFDMVLKTRVWPCMMGYNPCVQPISASDFSAAVASLLIDQSVIWKPEFLWGGPEVFTWQQLGHLTEDTIGKHLFFVYIPVILWQLWIQMFLFTGILFPLFNKLAVVLKMFGMIMAANATSERHEKIGKDMVEGYLQEHTHPVVDVLH